MRMRSTGGAAGLALLLAVSAGVIAPRRSAAGDPGAAKEDGAVAAMAAARAARDQGDLAAATTHAERAFELATTPELRRDALRLVVMFDLLAQRYYAAARRMPELRALEVSLGNRNGAAACDVHWAAVEASLGRLASALVRIDDAVAHFDAHGAAWERRGAHLNAARIRLEVSDLVRSRDHLEKARAASEGLPIHDASIQLVDAALSMREGQPVAAERAFREAIERAGKAAPGSRVAAQFGLVVALIEQRRLDDAASELERVRTSLAGGANVVAEVQLDVTACLVELARGDAGRAIELGLRARTRAPGLSGGWVALVEKRLARAMLLKDDPAGALDAAERAVAALLRDSGALPDVVGARYRADRGDAFAWGADAAVRLSDVDRLYRLAELGRAASLRATLGAEQLVDRRLDATFLDERSRLAEREAEVMGVYRATLGRSDVEAQKTAFASVAAVREQVDRFHERVRAKHGLAGHVAAPVVAPLSRVREALGEDEALVVYASGSRDLFAIVATRGEARIVTLGALVDVEVTVSTAVLEDRAMPADAAIEALRGALATPLGLPASIRRVRIVPVGAVGRVAFAAIWPDRELVRLPSVTVAALLDARPTIDAERIVAAEGAPFGPDRPIVGAAEEVRAVATEALLGDAATEVGVRAAIERAPSRAVHLACHALIDPVVPSRSALVFRPGPSSDGLLSLAEILGASIPAHLVVLSACSTGTGKRFGPEGDVGFTHGFFVAGARRVLASLWDVDDRATTELMKRFYEAWRPGVLACTALRTAQRALRADPRFAHPSYWAAWQICGGP